MTLEYPIMIAPLTPEDGGGFLATVPDLLGCTTDGDTPEEALAGIADAIAEWIDTARHLGRAVPPPSRLSVTGNAGEADTVPLSRLLRYPCG